MPSQASKNAVVLAMYGTLNNLNSIQGPMRLVQSFFTQVCADVQTLLNQLAFERFLPTALLITNSSLTQGRLPRVQYVRDPIQIRTYSPSSGESEELGQP